MLFGSKKIPELARGLGKGMREIKNATGDIQREIREGAKDISGIKDSVNVEKQVKSLFKEEAESEKKPSVEEENEEEKDTVPQAVHRRSPYESEESQNTPAKP